MEFIPQLVVTVAWNGAQWMQCRTTRKIILWWSHQKTLSVVSVVWHVLLFFHLLIDSKIISTSCTQSTQFIIFHNNYTYAIAGTSLRSAYKWRHWSLTISCHSIDHWDQYDTRLEDMIKIWTVHDKLISMTRSNMKWTRTWGKYDGNKHNMILCFFWSNLLILLLHLAAVPYIEYIFTVTFPQRVWPCRKLISLTPQPSRCLCCRIPWTIPGSLQMGVWAWKSFEWLRGSLAFCLSCLQ